MRFRALADLSDGFIFSAIGFGVFAAVAGTLASTPTLPASNEALGFEDVEAASMAPVTVDISMFTNPEPEPEAEPEPEVAEAAAEGEGDALPVRPAAPQTSKRTEKVVAATSPEAVATKSKTKPKPPRQCTEPPDALIQATGTNEWTVRKGVVKRYTKDWSNLDQLGWSTPHDGPDGRGDGMRIGGIRCGSDVYDAGFRSGDVIHSVNGRAVKSIPQALLVYAAIHNDDVFEVAITRKGQKRTLTYNLE